MEVYLLAFLLDRFLASMRLTLTDWLRAILLSYVEALEAGGEAVDANFYQSEWVRCLSLLIKVKVAPK